MLWVFVMKVKSVTHVIRPHGIKPETKEFTIVSSASNSSNRNATHPHCTNNRTATPNQSTYSDSTTPPTIPSFGDPIHTNKHFRYVLQNINGNFKTVVEKAVVISDLTKLSPDAVGITESNIQWTSQQAAQFCTATQALWPYSKEVHGNCIPDAHFQDPTSRQQGGIVQFLHGAHNGIIYQHSTDYLLGHWATQVLRLKEGRSLAIITAYCPCNASLATAGPGTIIMQQYREATSQTRSPGSKPSNAVSF